MSFVTMSHVLPTPPLRACARVLSLSRAPSLPLSSPPPPSPLPPPSCLLAACDLRRSLKNTFANSHKQRTYRISHGSSQPDTSFRQPESVKWVTDVTGQPLDFGQGAKLVKNTGVMSDKIPIRNSEKYLGGTILHFFCLATYWHPRFRSVFLLHRSSKTQTT